MTRCTALGCCSSALTNLPSSWSQPLFGPNFCEHGTLNSAAQHKPRCGTHTDSGIIVKSNHHEYVNLPLKLFVLKVQVNLIFLQQATKCKCINLCLSVCYQRKVEFECSHHLWWTMQVSAAADSPAASYCPLRQAAFVAEQRCSSVSFYHRATPLHNQNRLSRDPRWLLSGN